MLVRQVDKDELGGLRGSQVGKHHGTTSFYHVLLQGIEYFKATATNISLILLLESEFGFQVECIDESM